ncbi:FadR/GntR family transcriptional regulator [Aureimonas sp. AU22]|uniref:FadR/GntR family transcriptional regulator n=1 Tax=Aureimonas sp. AU22 TaxID=1638162 RepID=UPI0009E8C4F6|nr:FadR/GntR family transcriptional regulator [Aureimonas sp. AU22]
MSSDVSITRGDTDTRSGYERVVSFLREQLLSGQLKTGDCLLPERELSARLNVSRPMLREALRALAMIGAVEIRHGVGTIVKRPDVSTLGEFFSFVLAQQADVIDDIMEARIAIEHHAVRLACRRATQPDLDRIADALKLIAETIHDVEAGGAADFRFHEAIVRAAHSPTLVSIYGSLSALMMRSHLDRREQIIRIEGIDEFLIDHHRLIFSAVVDRDAPKADDLLTRHFEIGAEFRRRATMIETAQRMRERRGTAPHPAPPNGQNPRNDP